MQYDSIQVFATLACSCPPSTISHNKIEQAREYFHQILARSVMRATRGRELRILGHHHQCRLQRATGPSSFKTQEATKKRFVDVGSAPVMKWRSEPGTRKSSLWIAFLKVRDFPVSLPWRSVVLHCSEKINRRPSCEAPQGGQVERNHC